MPPFIDLTGQRFERLAVTGPHKRTKNGTLWRCLCDCGETRWVNSSALKSGATKSCGCLQKQVVAQRGLKPMAGKRFGKLVVLDSNRKIKRLVEWECLCDCGERCWKSGQLLRNGSAKSCGCVPRNTSQPIIDLTGKRFGRWEVIGPREIRKGVPVWFCQCECGETAWPSGQSLREGKSKSCGCLAAEKASERFLKSLAGQKIGRLTISERTKRRNKVVYWWCRCDCGKEKWIGAPALHSGATQSCGCYGREAVVKGALKSSRRRSIRLSAEERSSLEIAAQGEDENALNARIILLSDQGPLGPSLTDAEIAQNLDIKRHRVQYARNKHVAPEVIKKRARSAVEKARIDPKARMSRIRARRKYDSKPETKVKKREYASNLPPHVREKKKKRAREYRQTPAGKAMRRKELEKQREFRRTPEGKAKKREYHQRSKQRSNRRYQERYRTDPQFRVAVVLRKRIAMALKTRGVSKSKSLRELLGCSIQELRVHLERQFRPGMSWENHGEWHIDHIRPCAAFDLTLVAEQKVCFHYSNLQPLWAEENMKKSAKLEFSLDSV
jgi:hypothetical protein